MTCVTLSAVVAWCLLFVNTERYGLPFVFPRSLIMGKENYTEHTMLLKNKKKSAHYSLRAQLFQFLCNPSWKIKRFVCFSFDWLLSGRVNCTDQMWFRAHQNTNECRSLLLRKHNSKEGILGLAWLRPHRSKGTCNPNLGKYWRNQQHLSTDRWGLVVDHMFAVETIKCHQFWRRFMPAF